MDKVNTAMEVNKVFKEKGTCAQTYFFILNRYFKNANEIYESASDLLAGGIMNRGYQCGMLWGSSLAVGMDSFRRYGNCPQGWNRTIETTRKICESFSRRTGTNNCRDYTGCDLTSILGFVKFTWLSFSKGLENSPCFKLAGMWVEEAIQTASENLNNKSSNLNEPALNCASVTAEKLGASDEEIAIVAGFAGGLGLQGNACGALAALIWIKMVRWCERNQEKKHHISITKQEKVL